MKKLAVLLVLLAIGYIYRDEALSLIDGKRYSLETLAANPMPKRALFEHWQNVGLKLCDQGSQEKHNLTSSQCREKVEERHSSCLTQASRNAPDRVADLKVAKALGREYLQCVTPYYFCNGVEVRTEAEMAAQCK